MAGRSCSSRSSKCALSGSPTVKEVMATELDVLKKPRHVDTWMYALVVDPLELSAVESLFLISRM